MDCLHRFFARHEILSVEGLAAERHRPGPVALRGRPGAQRAAPFARLPGMREDPLGTPARPLLKMRAARAMLAERPPPA